MSQDISNSASPEIKTRKVELVLQQLDSLPTLPMIAMRLMALTGSADSKVQEVVALISADQSLTSKLLSLANSAALGIKAPITSVQQAIVMLGFDAVRNLALSVKVFEVFQHRPAEGETSDGPPPTKPLRSHRILEALAGRRHRRRDARPLLQAAAQFA